MDLLHARAEQRLFRKMAYEIQEIAKQTNYPIHENNTQTDSYIKLSDVIHILQQNAPMNFPLLDD